MKGEPAKSSLHVHLLGKFEVEVDGDLIQESRWQRRSAKHLIKLLGLRPGHQLHREQVMESLWPESPPDAAANNLNKVIHMVRRALEPELRSGAQSRFVHRESNHVVLRAPGGLWIDVDAFETQATEAMKHDTAEQYETALTHYSGDLLDEDLYEEWIWKKRDKLKRLHLELISKLARIYEASGRIRESILCLNELLESEPTNEEINRWLMELYVSVGRRQQALTQYERCAAALKEQLDAEPEAATKKLYEEILSGQYCAPVREQRALREASDSLVDSLAVLPLHNTSDDPELDYLGEGISESLTNKLAQLPGLRVMARSTVIRYKVSDVDVRTIGKELGVRAVLSGRVMQRGDRLVVGSELVSVPDGSLLWGEQYNRVLTDVFDIQEEIARNISEKLRLQLTSADRERLEKRHTQSPQAYELYLKGRFNWNKRTAAGLKKGLDLFNRAIEQDPAYSLAYAGLADCYRLLSLYSATAPKQSMPRARAAAARAIELDETLAEGHTAMAYCKLYYDWDWSGAERGIQRALQLNPNYATAYQCYHEYLTAMGRFDEQAVQTGKAKELDPLSSIIDAEVGWGLYFARRYDQAIEHLVSAMEIESRFSIAHYVLGLLFQQTGRSEKAVTEFETAIDLQEGNPFALALGVLGYAYAKCGNTELAGKQLQELEQVAAQCYVSQYCFALVHLGLGNKNDALTCLEKAYGERYDRMIYLNVEPVFDSLRKHPRFRELIRHLGFQ